MICIPLDAGRKNALFLAAINRQLLIDVADVDLNDEIEAYLSAAGILAEVRSVVLDVNRSVLFIRIDEDSQHGASFRHSYEIGEAIKSHFLKSAGKTIDAVYWKFPVKLED